MKLTKVERSAAQHKLHSWGINNCKVLVNGDVIDKTTNNFLGRIESVVWNLNKYCVGGLINRINYIHYKTKYQYDKEEEQDNGDQPE